MISMGQLLMLVIDNNGNSGGESEADDTLTESSDDLPSLSLLVSVLLISIIAIFKRQR